MKAIIIILIFSVHQTNGQSKVNESLKAKEDVIIRIAKLCTKEDSAQGKLISVLKTYKSQVASLRKNHNRDSTRGEMLMLRKELDETIKAEFGDEVFKRFILVTRPICNPIRERKLPIISNRIKKGKRSKPPIEKF